MAPRLELKVARVLSDTEIAINGGHDKNVKTGGQARVVDIVPVHDPETDEHLGNAMVTRWRFEVTAVAPRYSIARISDTYVVANQRLLRRVVENAEETGPWTANVAIGDTVTVEVEDPFPQSAADDDITF